MLIPDVINTLLMGLIFMVIVVTVIRPFVLHIIGGDVVEDEMHKAAMKAVEREMLRNGEQSEARRAEQLRYQMLLQDVPEKPKRKALPPPPEPVVDEEEELEEEDELNVPAQEAEASAVPASSEVMPEAEAADPMPAEGVANAAPEATAQDTVSETTDNVAAAEAAATQEEQPVAEGEIEIREGETLAEIKERLKREQKAKKPTIPPELLNSANSYEDKVGVVRMVVQADQSRVAQAIRSMIKLDK
jgi:hypothetical protein